MLHGPGRRRSVLGICALLALGGLALVASACDDGDSGDPGGDLGNDVLDMAADVTTPDTGGADVPGDATSPDTEPGDVAGDTGGDTPGDTTPTPDTPSDLAMDAVDTTPTSCVEAQAVLQPVTPGGCTYDPAGLDVSRMNINLNDGSFSMSPCRRESAADCGSSDHGWYVDENGAVTLCAITCEMWAPRAPDVTATVGCELRLCPPDVCFPNGTACEADVQCCTRNCTDAGVCEQRVGCTYAGGACTRESASSCCSGRCDGDSCCGFIGDPCPTGFGCCQGSCVDGVCGCDPGDTLCNGNCVDTQTHDAHCGACNQACPANTVCQGGSCVCDPTLEPLFWEQCGDACVDLRTSNEHCGACNQACPAGRTCSGSSCQCPAGQQDCGGVCLTPNTMEHCGSCFNACDAATETCNGSFCECAPGLSFCPAAGCVDLQNDRTNCGTCGNVCPGNKQCVAGAC